ncbi:response regulator [Paenibacillus sp. MMS20-IR301]|uniref:response regulator transcription factor n=1 Tax=Paenibacillus sp. MMS20-IR301 TaxID=2895946 RepID=UPI0028E6C821|nr:response regulator [Paenibacillus sp. MMS20-IR301]WNS46031.1 response regulator [Paenibacillus sp. MMS20-IR301]
MIKVLIVDDDNLVRKGLRSMLPWGEYGMEVAGEANNGEKALELLAQQQVDLLLTDLAMPVMSGMELMRIVRKEYPRICIVVLTLHQDFEYIQDCLRLGAIDYIAKVELETDSYDEVMGRIMRRVLEEQAKNPAPAVFYDAPACGKQQEERIAEPEPPLQPAAEIEAVIAGLKQYGRTLGWVHKASEFERFREELKQASLPPAKLMLLLNSLMLGWNRIYSSVTSRQIELPDSFNSWAEAEAWLRKTREDFVAAIGKAQYSEEVQECIMRAVQAMHEELAEPVMASEMSKRVNMSRSYFSQCFKDIVGMTFNEYLRSIRMEKAKEYLQHTQKNIQWISEHTGYTDQKYFSRVFYEKSGMLPSEYRQRVQDGAQMSGR